MRALLVVNPAATRTTERAREVIRLALGSELDLSIEQTEERGHARELGHKATVDGYDAVLTLGGDGTFNEVVNGILEVAGPGGQAPVVGALPGGSANVFARALGLPRDPTEATGALLEALRLRRTRRIGLGRANDRWFVLNAGVGLDAEIIESMESQRADGAKATPRRYVRTALTHYLRETDRSTAALRIERPGVDPIEDVHLVIVQNTSPWTFVGELPVDPCPRASFDTGLDVFALRTMTLLGVTRYTRRILARSRAGSTRNLALLHDQRTFTIRASHPMALQVDGDSVGHLDEVRFDAVPVALEVLVE